MGIVWVNQADSDSTSPFWPMSTEVPRRPHLLNLEANCTGLHDLTIRSGWRFLTFSMCLILFNPFWDFEI